MLSQISDSSTNIVTHMTVIADLFPFAMSIITFVFTFFMCVLQLRFITVVDASELNIECPQNYMRSMLAKLLC